MSSTTISLQGSSSDLPIIEANLMPFHINHTGSAPLSTYFLISPQLPPEKKDGSSLPPSKTRFTSTFRGRKMQGMAVGVPEGYTGLVFVGDSEGENGIAAKRSRRSVSPQKSARKNGRATRHSKVVYDNVDMTDESAADEVLQGDASQPTKTLKAVGQFSSFTLWNPDVDVDEGNDEYLRSISEYRDILSELHRTDI